MKRFLSILLALMLSLLSACGGGEGEDVPDPPAPDGNAGETTLPPAEATPGEPEGEGEPAEEQPAEQGGALVVYFSATGTTEGVAEAIADAAGADLFAILPETPYTEADLNYHSDCRANDEQQDGAARPAIAASCTVENWDEYDVVFLGHPIWWGIPPKIMRTFAESYDWTGKTVVGFCTSGGSGYSNEGLPELTEGAEWLEGRRFSAGTDAGEISDWVESLQLDLGDPAEKRRVSISFNGHTYTAALADNTSAEAFAALLEENGGSVTVDAHDYGGFEKVGDLPEALPRNDEAIDTTAGDLILYEGSSIVLYYAENSWTFTRLGRLEGDLSALQADLGEGDVSITYALMQ